MPSQNLSTTVAEIDRDHRMIVLALLRRLAALSTDQLTHVLANGRVGDPLELCQELEALLATSRAQYRRLNNARIHRRGRATSLDPNAPAALRPFTRNGPYVGAYDDLRALARSVLPDDSRWAKLGPYLDLDTLALELHLDGALWTLDHQGKIHAFRCPPDDHDLGRASSHETRADLGPPTKKARRRNRRRRRNA